MFLTFPTAPSRQKSWQTVLETVDNMRTGDTSFLNGKSLFNFHYPKPIWNSGSTLDESTSTLPQRWEKEMNSKTIIMLAKVESVPRLLTRIVTSNTRKLVNCGTRFDSDSSKVPRFLRTFPVIHSCTLTLGS